MKQEIIEAEPNALVTLPKVQMTKTNLIIPENTDFNEWKIIGSQLKNIDGAIQFWVGDWINFGEHHFEDKYLVAMAATGYNYETLRTQGYVAARFQTAPRGINTSPELSDLARRHEDLSWTHHREVASLSTEVANRLLDKAETEHLSHRELAAEVREWREEHSPNKAIEHKERPFSLAQEPYVTSYVDDIMDIKLRTNRLLQETRDPVVRKYYLELGGKVLAEILDLIKKYPEIDL